jgi:hypothetical protein
MLAVDLVRTGLAAMAPPGLCSAKRQVFEGGVVTYLLLVLT